MIPAIQSAGGAVVTSADVVQVLVEGGRAVGVRLADGREIRSNVVSTGQCFVNSICCARYIQGHRDDHNGMAVV
jgi:all-trans-retinol 13,14-reductase